MDKEKSRAIRQCLTMSIVGWLIILPELWDQYIGNPGNEVSIPFLATAICLFNCLWWLGFLKRDHYAEASWKTLLKETRLTLAYIPIFLGALAVAVELVFSYTAPRAWAETAVDIPCAIIIACCCVISLTASVVRYIREYQQMVASRKAIRAAKNAENIPMERPDEKKVRWFLLAAIACSALTLLALWLFFFGISESERLERSFFDSPFLRAGVFLGSCLCALHILKQNRNEDDCWTAFLKETKLVSIAIPNLLGFLAVAVQSFITFANGIGSSLTASESIVASTPCAIAIACCCAVAIVASLIRMIRGILASKQAT